MPRFPSRSADLCPESSHLPCERPGSSALSPAGCLLGLQRLATPSIPSHAHAHPCARSPPLPEPRFFCCRRSYCASSSLRRHAAHSSACRARAFASRFGGTSQRGSLQKGQHAGRSSFAGCHRWPQRRHSKVGSFSLSALMKTSGTPRRTARDVREERSAWRA